MEAAYIYRKTALDRLIEQQAEERAAYEQEAAEMRQRIAELTRAQAEAEKALRYAADRIAALEQDRQDLQSIVDMWDFGARAFLSDALDSMVMA